MKKNVLKSCKKENLVSEGEGSVLRGNEYFDEECLRTELKKRAVKGAGLSILSQFFMISIQFGGGIVLARLLTPEDFGLVAMVSVVWLLVLNFGYNGFTEAIVQKKDLKSDEVNALFWINLIISVLISLLFFLSSKVLSWAYDDQRVTSIAMVMSLPIIFMALGTEHMALLTRGMMFGKIALSSVASAVLSLAIGIGLAMSGKGYWALVIKQVAFYVFSAVGAWVVCAWRPGKPSFHAGIGAMVRRKTH